jgi:hypothetical protein
MALPRYLITEADKGRTFERILRPPDDDPNSTFIGKMLDSLTGKAIEDVIVTLDNSVVRSVLMDGCCEILTIRTQKQAHLQTRQMKSLKPFFAWSCRV